MTDLTLMLYQANRAERICRTRYRSAGDRLVEHVESLAAQPEAIALRGHLEGAAGLYRRSVREAETDFREDHP